MNHVAAAIAQAIADEGTGHVFGLMGSGNLLTTHALHADHGIPFHNARHEAQGVAAADAYARVTGTVGVCMVTQGPAFTNALTALVTAHRARTPLLLLAADSSELAQDDRLTAVLQSLDQGAAAAGLGLSVRRLEPQRCIPAIAEAFADARDGQRPIVVNVPTQYLTDRYEGPLDAGAARPRRADHLAAEQISAAADALLKARRPVVLAGLGAVRAEAGQDLSRLAAHCGAVLATSWRAAALFAGEDYAVGVSGGFSPPGVAELLEQADCVLAVGASLNHFTTAKRRLYREATVIHCDRDAEAFSRFRAADVAVLGDAAEVTRALLAAVTARGPAVGGWRAELDPGDLAVRRALPLPDDPVGPRLDPRPLCAALDRVLPAERTVVVDGGLFALVVADHVSVPDPRAVVWMLDFLATGGAMGAAAGAALGRPDCLAVLFIGDGGMMMTLGDLDLAIRDRVPLLVIVLNDAAYGAEVQQLRRAGLDDTLARFATPDLAAIADAMGAEGMTIRSLDDVATLRERIALGLDGPFVVDAHIESILPRAIASV